MKPRLQHKRVISIAYSKTGGGLVVFLRFPTLHRCAGGRGCLMIGRLTESPLVNDHKSARLMVMIGRPEAHQSFYICLYLSISISVPFHI